MFDVACAGGEEGYRGKLRLGRRSREFGSGKSPEENLKEAAIPIMAALSVMSLAE